MKVHTDIDSYIAGSPKEIQPALRALRAIIRKAAPRAIEKISYGMPAYALNGYLVYFAGWKNHIGFYPASGSAVAAFKKELAPYDVSRGTIRFPLDARLPKGLITRIIKHRIRENAAKK